MGNAPILQDARETYVGIGIDHDDRCATQMKLLDNAETDALQAAHNDVIAQVVISLRYQFNSPPKWLSSQVAMLLWVPVMGA